LTNFKIFFLTQCSCRCQRYVDLKVQSPLHHPHFWTFAQLCQRKKVSLAKIHKLRLLSFHPHHVEQVRHYSVRIGHLRTMLGGHRIQGDFQQLEGDGWVRRLHWGLARGRRTADNRILDAVLLMRRLLGRSFGLRVGLLVRRRRSRSRLKFYARERTNSFGGSTMLEGRTGTDRQSRCSWRITRMYWNTEDGICIIVEGDRMVESAIVPQSVWTYVSFV
jgi:hypothetical protein